MGERQVRGRARHRLVALERDLMEAERGDAATGLHDLDVLERDAAAHPGPECFRSRFLGRESRGQMRKRILVPAAVLQLLDGEQPRLHAMAEALERLPDPIHLHDVDPDAANGHARSPGFTMRMRRTMLGVAFEGVKAFRARGLELSSAQSTLPGCRTSPPDR